MSSFTKEVEYRTHGRGLYEVTKPFRFYIGDQCTGEYISVPAGFLTNFMSSPKWSHSIYTPDSDTVRASSCVHDGMVGEFGRYLPIMLDGNIVSRASWHTAARWYRKALAVRGTGLFWRWFFYGMVVAYGFYKKTRNTFF